MDFAQTGSARQCLGDLLDPVTIRIEHQHLSGQAAQEFIVIRDRPIDDEQCRFRRRVEWSCREEQTIFKGF